jgi:type II secretory ATPase GspE/PulE/Tfp pilus assembly ATPase PilB-like protein
MDIAERRLPQDGRMTLTTSQGEYDMRVSTYPSVHGENMVLRILDKDSSRLTLQKLGIAPDTRQEIERLIFRPHGMFLVCGPTGSGKTTTLYACLNALNSVERNIMTIEDPVEYQLTGIVQGSVNPKAGITFAAGLRSLVRQDPDVLLVGEIRDTETARIAVEAALTGHLVLSTIHANDAASAVTRLVDMGVEPFLVASALSAALAQRLMRVVCNECACPALLDEQTAQTLRAEGWSNLESAKLRRGAGCEACSKSGFRGRTGIHELMEVNPEIQRLILARASSQEIAEIALRGRRSLRQDAFSKMFGGTTTYEEVVRVTV